MACHRPPKGVRPGSCSLKRAGGPKRTMLDKTDVVPGLPARVGDPANGRKHAQDSGAQSIAPMMMRPVIPWPTPVTAFRPVIYIAAAVLDATVLALAQDILSTL